MEYTQGLRDKKGCVFSINCSKIKGVWKEAVKKARLIEGFGLAEDAHSGPGLRQVSLLAIESIRKQIACPKVKKKDITLAPGDFAENITSLGLNLTELNIGTRLMIGKEAILEISQIGKDCHRYCAIYYKTGDCIMPREGIFAKVVKGGEIAVGDEIAIVEFKTGNGKTDYR